MNQDSYNLNLFYIFFYIVWPPCQIYYLHVDGAGRTILVLSIVALLYNLKAFVRQPNVICSPAFLCWMSLVLFSVCNSIVKGFVSEFGALSFYKTNYITPFAFLFVLVSELDRDWEQCLRILFYSLLTYVLLCLGNMSFITRGSDERFMAEGVGNLLPLYSTCLVFVGGILNARKNLSLRFFSIVVILAITVTILSGTRKALGAIFILLVGILLHTRDGEARNMRFFFRIAFFFIFLYFGLFFLMDNTMIGERFAETAEQSDVRFVENESTNLILNTLLGDRAIQYELGYLLFLMNPWTGIGITNFISVSGFPFRLHTEYMVQLCENGIIGFSLLMLFYYFLVKKILERHKEYCDDITLMLFGLFTILFLNITAWTYCTTFGMIYYGLLIVYAYSNEPIEDNEEESFGEEETTNDILLENV